MNNDVYVVVLVSGLDTKVICVFSKYDDAERFVLKEWMNYVTFGSNPALLELEMEFRVLDINNGHATMTDQVFSIMRREFNP